MYIETWFTFLIVTTASSLSPGPAVILVTSQATTHGVTGAIRGIIGGQLAMAINYSLVALGLGAVLATLPGIFTILRYIGAAYLVWLGLTMVSSSLQKHASGSSSTPPLSRLFRAGFLMQITNPKSLLFISALAPQFLSSSSPIWQQVMILATTAITADTLICLGYAFLAFKAAGIFRHRRLQKVLGVSSGSFLVATGVKLALTEQR
jgi:homoserine/homoserine lactone efflux protein